jgi:hypothetical protein
MSSVCIIGLEASEGVHQVFVSKEMLMAEVCRKVAVSGFEPIPEVFSLGRW